MTMLFSKVLILILLLLLPWSAFAQEDADSDSVHFIDPNQSEIDSLLKVVKSGVHDTVKAKCYCRIGYIAENPDTVLKYSNMSLPLCDKEAYGMIGQNYSNKGWAYYMKDQCSDAIAAYLESLNYFKKVDDKYHVAIVYVALAKCHHEVNARDCIFTYFEHALNIFIETHDTTNITYVYRAIGSVNADLGFDDNAVAYFQKAIALDSASKNYPDLGGDLLSLANSEKDLMLALRYAKYAVTLLDSIPSQDSYHVLLKYDAYRRMAQIYIKAAQDFSRREYADSCLAYVKKVGNTLLAFGGYANHLQIRMTYAQYLSYVGKNREALDVLLECEQYLGDNTRNALNADFNEALSDAYEKIGDYKNAIKHYKQMYAYRTKYANDSTLNIISNFKTEQALRVQEAEKKQLYADRQRMKTILISLVCGLILVSLLIFYITRALDIKHKANLQLSEKNSILLSQKREIESQRDEIMAQRDEIAVQKDIITKQWQEVESVNNKLISSIHYAQRIQRAAVSSDADVRELFPDSFVFYRPRDIVSGDYYLAVRCGRYSVMVVGDCTGHGIPGAFLSMLGISALKEFLVTEADAKNPGNVLDRLRIFIKTTLSSSYNGKSISDGMDMTICCYDFENMELRYAMANQTAIMIRDGNAAKLKGDPMPVGAFVREKDHFENFTMKIEKGDLIYTFSDGIQDQLGGGDRRKFLQRNMMQMLAEISAKPMLQQKQVVEQKILEWRGATPQVDDMTLIGIRV